MTEFSALSTTSSRSDAADSVLIAQSRRTPELFGVLFERHAADIHAYAARRLGVPAADDLMAETFLIAFRHRGRYDQSRGSARPWLYGIATNLIARHRRAEARAYRALARTGTDPLAESFADDAIARVTAAGVRPLLAEALAGLQPRDRDVLLLIAWADLTYDQVSESLGIPIGTVRSRLHRARSQVREALRDLDPAREAILNEGTQRNG
jgi:RNA polymerase sigma-70 factor (ECF subfamily)